MNTISTVFGSNSGIQWETTKPASVEPRQTQPADAHDASVQGDSVHVNASGTAQPTLIADEDVASVMEETVSMIAEDPYAAMHAHSGLDASRIAALLA